MPERVRNVVLLIVVILMLAAWTALVIKISEGKHGPLRGTRPSQPAGELYELW